MDLDQATHAEFYKAKLSLLLFIKYFFLNYQAYYENNNIFTGATCITGCLY